MCVALAAVTSLIRIYTFPFGGSVTLFSMLFIMLPAWFYGVKEGVISGLIFGILQFVIEPYFLSVPQFILDYILAFSVMGIAGFFRNNKAYRLRDSRTGRGRTGGMAPAARSSFPLHDKSGLLTGYIIAVIARWIIATLAGLAWFSAGMAAWDGWAPLPYSMAYNAIYIFTEGIVTVIVLLIPSMRRALENVRQTAAGSDE